MIVSTVMQKILISFAVSAVASVLLTPLAIRLSEYLKVLDRPSPRKIHSEPRGRLGGVAIYFAFLIGILAPAKLGLPIETAISFDMSVAGFLLSSLIIVILGVFDDKYDLTPRFKFFVQILAATILVTFGLKIEMISGINPGTRFDLGVLKIPATIFWVVAITNMINFIDGLDGLAAGITVIASLTLIVINYMDKLSINSCVILASMAGACTGFLRYNFHPARVFMGDGGATFLGFTLGVTSVMGAFKSATFAIVLVPFLALLIPIFDMIYAILRRITREIPPHIADKEHLHHQFLELGLSHKQAVIVLYIIALSLSFFSIGMAKINNIKAMFLLLLICLLFIIGMIRMRHIINAKRNAAARAEGNGGGTEADAGGPPNGKARNDENIPPAGDNR